MRCLLRAWKCAKIVFGRDFALDPTGGAYSAPPDSLAGGELAAPSLRTQPRLDPFGLGLWPYGPRCPVSQTPIPENKS